MARLAFPGSLGLRLWAGGAGQAAILEIECVEHIAATARPPDPVARGIGGQAEPALAHRLAVDDFSFLHIDDGELMCVVPGRGRECMAIIGQCHDVERKVGECDRASGRFQGPAVREEEALVGRACVMRLILGACGADGDQATNQESRRRHRQEQPEPGHESYLQRNEVTGHDPDTSASHADGRQLRSPMSFWCSQRFAGIQVSTGARMLC